MVTFADELLAQDATEQILDGATLAEMLLPSILLGEGCAGEAAVLGLAG